MGVVYLLIYILGGALVTLGVSHVTEDVLKGAPVGDALVPVALGAGLICLAGLLHALVERRRNPGGTSRASSSRMGRRSLALAGAMWAVPIIVAWIQFELFINPVLAMPHATVLGGIALTFGVCSHLMAKWPLRRVATTMAVAVVGLPFGLLGAALPIQHFTHHLTDVVIPLRDPVTREDRSIEHKRDEVDMPTAPLRVDEATLDLVRAFAEAKTINVADEIAAGRMRQLEDGSYVTVNPDGTETPLGGRGDMEQAFAEARETDEQRATEEQAARVAEWERELLQRKQGGRLFSRVAPD